MPCISEHPSVDWANQLEMMLEQAFRYLTREQISSIHGSPNSGWIGALEWYEKHLMFDYHKNYADEGLRNLYQNEANRLGWQINKINGGVEIVEINKAIT